VEKVGKTSGQSLHYKHASQMIQQTNIIDSQHSRYLLNSVNFTENLVLF